MSFVEDNTDYVKNFFRGELLVKLGLLFQKEYLAH